MPLLMLLIACDESKVPEDALFFEVTATGIADSCHPAATEGSVETLTYALAFDASSATIYIGEDVFAVGSITGCDLQYQTVIIGSETEADGFVHWQLFGQASLDAGTNACVEGDNDWEGSETFEIQSSDDETLEPGCTYDMETTGRFIPAE